MYNGVLQTLDLRIEVVSPIAYLDKAISSDLPNRDIILTKCKQLLIKGETTIEGCEWTNIVNMCLFHHPRIIAHSLFDIALKLCLTDEGEFVFSQSQIEYIVQGIL
jgi:hypothetical protein